MTVSTICFMVRSPLTKRDHDRFGLELIRRKGYEAAVLDLTMLLNPGYKLPQDAMDDKGTVQIKQKAELAQFLKTKGKAIFVVDLIGAEYSTLFIYRNFKKYGVIYAGFALNALPVFKKANSPVQTLAKFFSKRIFKTASKIFLAAAFGYICRALLAIGQIKSPDYLLIGGNQAIYKLPLPNAATKRIYGHALDYDIVLHEKMKPADQGYAVFLDQYAPFHPDTIISKNDLVEAKAYYSGLNCFFDWFERQTGKKVVIAAHPRSDYERRPECYGIRQTVKGKTADMIAGADCVLLHESTAINFAVCLRKPLLFLTCDQFERTYHGPGITESARQFGKVPINVDRPFTSDLLDLSFDRRLYSQYIENYVKAPGSPERPVWEIVIEELRANRS